MAKRLRVSVPALRMGVAFGDTRAAFRIGRWTGHVAELRCTEIVLHASRPLALRATLAMLQRRNLGRLPLTAQGNAS